MMVAVRGDGAMVIAMHGTTRIVTRDVERIAYSPQEVAERLGVSRRKIYRLLEAGEIEKIMVGRRSMILVADLDAYINRLKASEAA